MSTQKSAKPENQPHPARRALLTGGAVGLAAVPHKAALWGVGGKPASCARATPASTCTTRRPDIHPSG